MHAGLRRWEADEAAEGKGINAPSLSPSRLVFRERERERQRKVKQDPSRFILTPTPFQPPSTEAEIGGKGSDIRASVNFKSLWSTGSFTVREERRGKSNSLQDGKSSMTLSPLDTFWNVNMCEPLQHNLGRFPPPVYSSLGRL